MSNPFSGNTQNANMWNAEQFYEEDRLRKQLEVLEKQRNSIIESIHSPNMEAEDQDKAGELAMLKEDIEALKKEIKEKYPVKGGRRKRNQRTKRAGRRSKSRAKKSRRSKH